MAASFLGVWGGFVWGWVFVFFFFPNVVELFVSSPRSDWARPSN